MNGTLSVWTLAYSWTLGQLPKVALVGKTDELKG